MLGRFSFHRKLLMTGAVCQYFFTIYWLIEVHDRYFIINLRARCCKIHLAGDSSPIRISPPKKIVGRYIIETDKNLLFFPKKMFGEKKYSPFSVWGLKCK